MKKNAPTHHVSPLITAILFFLVILLAMSSCELQSLTPQKTGDGAGTVLQPSESTAEVTATTVPHQTTTVPPAITTEAPVTTTAPRRYFNPLNGLPCEEASASRRPIAIAVKEASAAETATADLVIEAPTEGVSNRLLLVGTASETLFGCAEIASIRPYLAAIANDFFAISVYHGTSDRDKESFAFPYDTVDTKATALEQTEAALLNTIAAAGYQSTIAGQIALPYTISDIGVTVKPQTTSGYIAIPFSDAAKTVFTYDSLTKSYTMRSCTAVRDDTTPPSFANVIVLFFNSTLRVTKDGAELSLDTNLDGTGYYASQGGVVPISWRRDGETSRLYFSDENGNKLALNRGKTYIGMTTFDYSDRLILN